MDSNNDFAVSRRRFVGGAVSLALMGGAFASVPGDRALALAEARREDLILLLSDMIRVRSLSGESGEGVQEVVKSQLANLPYRIEQSADRPSQFESHAEYMPPNPPSDGPFINVIAWPEQSGGRNFAMFSHIDTHSLEEGWNTEPLTPVLDGNRLYGLGASDDKGGVAAMLIAAGALAAAGEALPVLMSLHGKGGGSRGSLPVFDRLSKTDHNIDAVLYVHPAETGRGLEDIKNSVQGVLDLELSVAGWRSPPMEIGSLDSAAWEGGGNAVDMCWRTLEHLRASLPNDVQVNVGMVEGGDRIGSVAETAAVRFRLKFSGEQTWRSLLTNAQRTLEDYASALPDSDPAYRMSLEAIGYRTNPGAADWNSPASRVLRESIESVTGRAPNAYPNHYAGDIRYPIRLLDVPAYGIGSLGGNFYGPNEWVDIDDLVKLVAVLIQTLAGWGALPDARSRDC